MVIIRTIDQQLSGIRAANPDIALAVVRDSVFAEELVLSVDYPAQAGPASRDIWIDAEQGDWSSGRAIVFLVKPAQAMTNSVSFVDRNGVAYTSWSELKGGEWQDVYVPFEEMRPNPYFQPAGADTETSLDVSRVERIGFAPQAQGAGQMWITRFSVAK